MYAVKVLIATGIASTKIYIYSIQREFGLKQKPKERAKKLLQKAIALTIDGFL